jgi:hypothetical protein
VVAAEQNSTASSKPAWMVLGRLRGERSNGNP